MAEVLAVGHGGHLDRLDGDVGESGTPTGGEALAETVPIVVELDRPGVELYDDWDGFGQRLTASGGTRFTDVAVEPIEVTTVSDGKHLGHSTAFLQLYLAAVAAGIAHGVRDDAVSYVR